MSALDDARPAFLPAVILVNQVVAVVCQFVQGTDPRFPLLYFTVDSAILAGAVAAVTLAGGHGAWFWRARLAATIGVVLSAIVFVVAIAPATPTGTWFQPHNDLPVRAATLLMHGVAPVLVTADYLTRRHRRSVRSSVLWSYPWPVAYFAALGVLVAAVGPDVVPYPFLRPGLIGWPTEGFIYVVLLVFIGLLGATLGGLDRILGRFWDGRRTSGIGGS